MASLLAFVVSAVIAIFVATYGSKYALPAQSWLESLTKPAAADLATRSVGVQRHLAAREHVPSGVGQPVERVLGQRRRVPHTSSRPSPGWRLVTPASVGPPQSIWVGRPELGKSVSAKDLLRI
jgi:hypothetical protein